ncbi:MAG TPA: hypothetical protein VFI11_11500 [Anaerolineales bacterium]|nr:hypothetical protein [Anaerolineales bacterium]
MTRRAASAPRRRYPYEHRSEPLLPRGLFLRRLALHAGLALGLAAVSLGIGVLGYRLIERLEWIDALLNASMILGGMGQISPLHTQAGKIFASAYALFSGAVFLVVSGIVIAPVAHRILHRLHLEEPEDT